MLSEKEKKAQIRIAAKIVQRKRNLTTAQQMRNPAPAKSLQSLKMMKKNN